MSRPPGRDRRAVAVPVPGGAPRLARPRRVAVVGAGIAGLAAATVLAERGAEVEVYERCDYLGGRVGGWPTTLADGGTVTMTRGFHAFFRQYYNLRALLARVGPRLTGLPDYPLWHADGHRESFAGIPRTPPLNALGYLLRSPTVRFSDLAKVNARAALGLLDVSTPGIYHELDHLDAASYLREIRFPPAARALALEVFSRSFFSHPGSLSAAELVTMFHVYFLGSAEGLLFDVPTDPFPEALWRPLAAYLRGLGVRIATATPVGRIEARAGGGFTVEAGASHGSVETAETAETVAAVVLATDVTGAQRLLEASPGLGEAGWRRRMAELRTAEPFAVTRLWLDRPVRADRPPFLGTSGFDPLDNISVLDRYERQAGEWARRTGGSVVELHGYALSEGVTEARVFPRLIAQLHRIYPETAAARVIDHRDELRADCPLFPPGGFAERPPVRTPVEGLVLAGDYVRADLPVALMERAATTGFLAANALLERWSVAGQPLWSVPRAGRGPLLRAVARRWARPSGTVAHPAAPARPAQPSVLARNQ